MILVGIAAVGLITDGIPATLRGIWTLQLHPARLVNDFSAIAGTGATLVNAVLVSAIGLFLVWINGIRVSGPSIAAIYTMLGFGLFGKTPLNCAPILFGVFIAARLAGKRFDQYILIALFGTALAPVVSMIAVELALPGIAAWPLAVAAGIAVGILLPPIAMAMLRFHQGFNLYNIGMTSGFLALFAASLVLAANGPLPGGTEWNTDPSVVMRVLIPVLSLLFILAGLLRSRSKALRDFVSITRLSGRLPSDFMDMVSISGGLVNMGVLGLASWGYVVIVGAPLNGPVLGGILTIIGFGAFGKHPVNCWPVMTGILAATLLFGIDVTAPGAILAILFGTTLAPIAGEFGIRLGLIAGFLHLVMVSRSGVWHAGISLYNNGFAGGLTATLLAAIMEWHQTNRDSTEKETT